MSDVLVYISDSFRREDKHEFNSLCIMSERDFSKWQSLYEQKVDFILQLPRKAYGAYSNSSFQELWSYIQVWRDPADIATIERMFGDTRRPRSEALLGTDDLQPILRTQFRWVQK